MTTVVSYGAGGRMNVSEMLASKRQLLFKCDSGVIHSAIINPCKSKKSKDGKYIHVGDYFSDTFSGWYEIEELSKSVIGIVKEFDAEKDDVIYENKRGFFKL